MPHEVLPPKPGRDDDGSIRLHFGPGLPTASRRPTSSRPSRNRAFLACIHCYGTATEFYDQTWKPDDVIKTY